MAHQAKTTAELQIPEACRIEASFLSDTGPARQANEDSAAVVVPTDSSILADKGVLIIVADGMGGHRAGGLASSTAVTEIADLFYRNSGSLEEVLTSAFQEANHRIFDQTRRDHELDGMGTTCTALVVREGLAYSAHVGDSRIYLIRGGCAYRMTEDHSATMQMVDMGLLTLDEASRHQHRNVILRAMGTQPTLDVAVWREPFPVRAGDCFVLCSDGLYEVLSDDEIATLSMAGTTAEEACRALLDAALARDCRDNVTAAVVRTAANL